MRTASPIEIFLIDERIFMLELLNAIFASSPQVKVVGTATHEDQARIQVAARRPAIVLLDASDATGVGLDLAWKLAEESPNTKLVFLDDRVDRGRVALATRMGAAGYFLRTRSFHTLLEGLAKVVAGHNVYDPDVAQYIGSSGEPVGGRIRNLYNQHVELTPRELEVLCLLAKGMTVRQCAQKLKLAESTIDNHKSRMMRKLGVHKSTQLALIAVRAGLVPTQPESGD